MNIFKRTNEPIVNVEEILSSLASVPESAPVIPEPQPPENVDHLRNRLQEAQAKLRQLRESENNAQRELDHERTERLEVRVGFTQPGERGTGGYPAGASIDRIRPDRLRIAELETSLATMVEQKQRQTSTVTDLLTRLDLAEAGKGVSASERIAKVAGGCRSRIARLEELALEFRSEEQALFSEMTALRTQPFARTEQKQTAEREWAWLAEQVRAVATRFKMIVNPAFGWNAFVRDRLPDLPEGPHFYDAFRARGAGAK